MLQHRCRLLALAFPGFALALASWLTLPCTNGLADPLPAAAKPSAAEVADLIRLLGSDKFAEREAAAKRLASFGSSAWEALRSAAATSDDPEIRRRAGQLLEE